MGANGNFKDMTGEQIGKWVVVSYAGKSYWNCRCVCGAERRVWGTHLRGGRSESCLRCHRGKMNRLSHGGRRTRLYNIWSGMKRRCLTPTDVAYPRYGGRGITVCEEWITSFEAFRDWSIANGYADHLTIDREKNNLGYSPGNCRWATKAQQNRNHSRNVNVTFRGELINVTELAERFGIKRYTLWQRITKYGMSADEAVALGAPKPEIISIGGKDISLSSACDDAGLSIAMVRKRLKRGWEPERALQP